MTLWIDQYRPTSLSSLSLHKDISCNLQSLTNSPDFPHLIMYGPEGCGKRTRIMAVLRSLYGPGVDKLKLDQRTITTTQSQKKIDVQIFVSNFHIEINPMDFNTSASHDKLIVQHLIKEIAQSPTILVSPNTPKFKLVIISNADSLSVLAQHALRRTLEKYMNNLRIIFCCCSISKLIKPIQSRCLLMRIPAPSMGDVRVVLNDVASAQGFSLDQSVTDRIASNSNRNLRRALLMLESLYVTNESPSHLGSNVDMSGIDLDWEVFISEIAKSILTEQSADQLNKIRPRLYDLLVHAIPPSIIFKNLTLDLIHQVPITIQADIVSASANYEHSMCLGSKPIFHLEAFIAKVMTIYKSYLVTAIHQ